MQQHVAGIKGLRGHAAGGGVGGGGGWARMLGGKEGQGW